MSTILDVIQLRAIELTAILVLGSMVAGLVTYIIRDLKGRYEKMAPKLQDQDSRISHLEGRMANDRREITIIIDMMDRRFGAIENRYDETRSDFKEMKSDINGMKTNIDELASRVNNIGGRVDVMEGRFGAMKREVSELRADLQGARNRINRDD